MSFMNRFPPPAEAQVTLANWRQAPYCRWAFHHVRELIPTVPIRRGETTWTLPRSPVHLDGLTFEDREGQSHRLMDALERNDTDAFIVLHRGQIVHEHYDHGMRADDPHILMSVSKSLTAAVAGVLIDRSVLEPASLLADIMPELEGSAYADANLQQLLDMRVGVAFEEDYEATSGVMIDYRRATGWNPPEHGKDDGDLRSFVRTLPQGGRHGGPFHYVSPNTDLLGWILERASGHSLATLISTLLWAPMGAEHEAYITVDRFGAGRAAGGLCVTLRDLARVGQMLLQHGVARDQAVLPGWWVRDTSTGGDSEAWRRGGFSHLLPAGRYRNKWYQVGDVLGSYLGLGFHGQFLYVAPAASVVIARFASYPVALDEASETLMIEAFGAIARELMAR